MHFVDNRVKVFAEKLVAILQIFQFNIHVAYCTALCLFPSLC